MVHHVVHGAVKLDITGSKRRRNSGASLELHEEGALSGADGVWVGP